MKKYLKTMAFVFTTAALLSVTACKDGSSTNEDSYGPTETSRDETPTMNDEATNKSASDHETGPGSATVGDTLHKNSDN